MIKRILRKVVRVAINTEEQDAFDKVKLDECREYLQDLREGKLSLTHLTMAEMRSRFEWLVTYSTKLFWRVDQLRDKVADQARVIEGLRGALVKIAKKGGGGA